MRRRREFIALIGGAAAAWPLAAHAQQLPVIPVVGFLGLFSSNRNAGAVTAILQGLAEAGFVEGRTVAIEYRWANGERGRLAPLAAELVQRKVAVIVAIDGGLTVLDAKAVTSTIPIVFSLSTDPIKFGLVDSLRRPGGNMTGVTGSSAEIMGKRVGLLCDMAPLATILAYITDPGAHETEAATSEVLAAARAVGRQAIILEAHNQSDIDAAFAKLADREPSALIVGPQILFESNAQKIVDLAARYKVPAIYDGRPYVLRGGLMSYHGVVPLGLIGSVYVAQILKGAKPADLPILQPDKFDLVINLKTAKTLGLTVPPTLLALADKVIE